MEQTTYLRISDKDGNYNPDHQIDLEGILMNFPLGHQIRVITLPDRDCAPGGVYEVVKGPEDCILLATEGEDDYIVPIYERHYDLRPIATEVKK